MMKRLDEAYRSFLQRRKTGLNREILLQDWLLLRSQLQCEAAWAGT